MISCDEITKSLDRKAALVVLGLILRSAGLLLDLRSHANIACRDLREVRQVVIFGCGCFLRSCHTTVVFNCRLLLLRVYSDTSGLSFLAHVTPTLAAADITFGNLEGVLVDGGEPGKKCSNPNACYLFRSPTRYAQLYRDAFRYAPCIPSY